MALTQSINLDLTLPLKKVNFHIQNSSDIPLSAVRVDIPNSGTFNIPLTIAEGIITTTVQNYYTEGTFTNDGGDTSLWLFPTASGTNYNVSAVPSGEPYVTTSSTLNVNSSGETFKTIILNQKKTFSGHLYSSQGDPLPNQLVTLRLNSTETSVFTDDLGRFELNVAPGNYTLIIIPSTVNHNIPNIPSFYCIEASVSLTEDTTTDITLPFKQVDIHTQDPDGLAVSGVQIGVANIGLNMVTLSLGNGITINKTQSYYTEGPFTNNEGNAILWLLPSGGRDYPLTATPSDGSPAVTSAIEVSDNTSKTIEIDTVKYTVSGHLTDPFGTPINNQLVILRGVTDNSAITDSSGLFNLQAKPGSYELVLLQNSPNDTNLKIPQFYTIKSNIDVFSDKDLELALPVKKVKVHVQNVLNEPLSGMRVDVANAGFFNIALPLTNELSTTAVYSYYGQGPITNDFGDADLWLFPSGDNTYSINIFPLGNSIYTPYSLNVSVINGHTEIVSLQVPTSTLSGIIYVDINQNGFQDEGESGYTNAVLTLDNGQSTTTDSNGEYTFSGIPSGTYIETLTIPPGYISTTTNPVTILLSTNATQNFGIAPLLTNTPTPTQIPTYSISGNVYLDANENGVQDSGENGYGGAEVVLTGEGSQTVQTDTAGAYSLSNLTSGNYTVSLTVPNGFVATTTNPAVLAVSANTTQNFGIALSSQPIGYPTPGDTEDNSNRDVMNGTKFTVGPVGGTVESISAYVGDISTAPDNQYQMAIYTSKANGKPGTIIAQTVVGTLIPNSWNTLPITATFSPFTSYWLMYNTKAASDDVNNLYFTSSEPNIGAYYAQTFGVWPASFPNNPTMTNQQFSMYVNMNPDSPLPTVLVGNDTIEAYQDSNNAGSAEAFQYTALTSGTANTVAIYLNNDNAATRVRVGIYTDNNGNPGTLLSQAEITNTLEGSWNTVTFPSTNITQGTTYWIAVLSPRNRGIVRFRDKASGGTSVGSQETNLTTLPATWTTGQTWTTSDLSAYLY